MQSAEVMINKVKRIHQQPLTCPGVILLCWGVRAGHEIDQPVTANAENTARITRK